MQLVVPPAVLARVKAVLVGNRVVARPDRRAAAPSPEAP
jgi:hypothetical protein